MCCLEAIGVGGGSLTVGGSRAGLEGIIAIDSESVVAIISATAGDCNVSISANVGECDFSISPIAGNRERLSPQLLEKL